MLGPGNDPDNRSRVLTGSFRIGYNLDMRCSPVIRLVALMVAAFDVCAQATVVSGGGAVLQQAVTSAAPGDTLLVQSGTYSSVVIDKALTVLCDPGVLIASNGRALHIHSLPASATVVVRGAEILTSLGFDTMQIDNCAGRVILDQVEDVSSYAHGRTTLLGCSGMILMRGFDAGHVWSQVTIGNCDHVEFVDSTDLPSLVVTTSAVHISNCLIPPRQNNMAAVTMTLSEVTVNSSNLSGGPLTISFWWSMPAINLVSGELMVVGGSTITGGTNAVNAPAIESTVGLVRLSLSSSLVGVGVPMMTGGATLQTEPIPAVSASTATSGQLFAGQLDAEPGSYSAVHFHLPAPPVQLPFGTIWIPLGSLAIDSGFVPANGVRQFVITMPPLPLALPILMQPVSATVGGLIVLGPPTPVLVN